MYFQSIFRIQNSEYAFHSICVFSVDFQKHASEYEVGENSEFSLSLTVPTVILGPTTSSTRRGRQIGY